MTPAEAEAILMSLKDLKDDVRDFQKTNTDSHDRIETHLNKLNGRTAECHNQIFGVSEDDPSILRRLTKLEKATAWLTKNWWWTIIIILGLIGSGGFAGQVIEGWWKRQLPL